MTTGGAASGALDVILGDVRDLVGALHVIADAAARRGDEDVRGALRLLARQGEGIAEGIERIAEEHER